MTENISLDTLPQRIADKILEFGKMGRATRDVLSSIAKHYQIPEGRLLGRLYTEENLSSNHHELLVPSANNQEQDRLITAWYEYIRSLHPQFPLLD